MSQITETPPTGPETHVHRAWWIAAVTGLTIIAAGAFTTVPGLLVDPLHQQFNWSHGTISLAASVNMVLFGVTAPFAAALMDRFGIRRVVASALTIIATGAALTTVMTQAWQLIFYWGVLIGLGSGSLTMTFAATVTNHWFTERRGLVTGVLTGASHFGQLAFLPLLAWIIDRYHWRPAIVTLTLAALAVAPLAWLLLRDHPADAGLKPYGAKDFVAKPAPVPGTASRAVRVLFGSAKTGPFWLLAGMFIICGASTNGIMWSNFTPAAHDHGMAPTVAASLLSVIGVFSLLGTLASGWLTDRYDPRRLLSVYFSVRAITLIFLPMLLAASVHPSMIAFVVCYGLVDVATVPPTIQLSREFYGKDGPIVFGWVNAAHQVGAGVSAFLGGVTRDAFGSYNIVWYVLAGFCATAALLALVIRRPGPAKGEADETLTEDKGEHPEFSKK